MNAKGNEIMNESAVNNITKSGSVQLWEPMKNAMRRKTNDL